MTLYWKREVPRIRAFERTAAERAGVLWSISSSDDEAWRSIHGLAPDGVLGVGLELARYHGVSAGPARSVLHIGYLDARKGDAMRRFARNVWPAVRRRVGDAELVLAGRGSDALDDPALGIRGLGFVESDADFLGEGQIFINPQVAGSGIKLKSIIAMAAGKALVGTPNAVEGIDGEEGRDFVVAADDTDYADKLAALLEAPDRAAALGDAGRQRVDALFSQERAEAQARDVIARWHQGGSA
jgi:glycosyltransferase involved in cell wall biosynthesis